MTEEEKQKQEALALVTKTAKDEAEKTASEAVTKAFEGKGFLGKDEVEGIVTKALNDQQAVSDEKLNQLSASVKKSMQTTKVVEQSMNIEQVLKASISENADKIKGFNGKLNIALKAVDNSSFAGTSLATQTTDVRRNLYMSPYSPFYLRNIFPNISTDGGAIVIPQIQGYTGAAAVWERGAGTTEKPEVTPTYKDITVTPKWIAGFTTVNRELLLNVSYLQSSIVNTLLYSKVGLFAAENKMITDYLSANAVAYSGDKTIGAEIILDAAFNQLLGNYLVPTHILMNQGDYLSYIKFNKAAGSGEYDVPNNELNVVNADGLEVKLQVVPVPSIPKGTAYVVAANEFEFINRLDPELKISEEHGNNFTFNKVTFRAEEMAAFIAKDLNAAVKIDLSAATNGAA